MKLANKIILFPIAIIVIIFALGVLTLEVYINKSLHVHLKEELSSLSAISLSSAKLITQTNTPEYIAQLNYLAKQIAKASQASVYFFSINGDKLASSDTNLDFSSIGDITYLQKNQKHFSYYYQPTTQKTWVLLTQLEPQLALISQIGLPKNYYTNTLLSMRWGLFLIGLVTLFTIFVFTVVIVKLINNTVRKERGHLQQEVTARTQEITLIQTMTTMVNSANSTKDAGIILANILPRLLPGYSGAIYLLKVPEKKLTLLAYWGDKIFKNIHVQLSENNKKTRFELDLPPCFEHSEQLKTQCIQIDLNNQNGCFGVAFFYHPNKSLTEDVQHTIKQLSSYISESLANVILTDQLRKQATKDPLTNLYNRRFMQEFLAKVVHRAERHHGCVAVLMIDLDHFKSFNDKFGHEAGDLILAEVAHTLRANIRLEDIACRYGGEEFCIICPDTKLTDAYHLAEKLRIKINQLSLSYQNKKLDNITMSIGIAVYPNHAPSCQVLIFKADQALYQAKDQGRNRSVVIPDDISENTATL